MPRSFLKTAVFLRDSGETLNCSDKFCTRSYTPWQCYLRYPATCQHKYVFTLLTPSLSVWHSALCVSANKLQRKSSSLVTEVELSHVTSTKQTCCRWVSECPNRSDDSLFIFAEALWASELQILYLAAESSRTACGKIPAATCQCPKSTNHNKHTPRILRCKFTHI